MLKKSIYLLLFAFLGANCQSSSSESTPYPQGATLYKKVCGQCHMDDGSGLGDNIPPLQGSEYMTTLRDQIPCIVRRGLKGEIKVAGKTYNQEMPPSIVPLNDIEIANIMNYLNHRWGDGKTFIQVSEVKKLLEACE
jgi:cytochrome c551